MKHSYIILLTLGILNITQISVGSEIPQEGTTGKCHPRQIRVRSSLAQYSSESTQGSIAAHSVEDTSEDTLANAVLSVPSTDEITPEEETDTSVNSPRTETSIQDENPERTMGQGICDFINEALTPQTIFRVAVVGIIDLVVVILEIFVF